MDIAISGPYFLDFWYRDESALMLFEHQRTTMVAKVVHRGTMMQLVLPSQHFIFTFPPITSPTSLYLLNVTILLIPLL
jgi:hypothetical protein